jgi:hypothetical protein
MTLRKLAWLTLCVLACDESAAVDSLSITARVEANPNSTLSAIVRVTTSRAARVSVSYAREADVAKLTAASPLGTEHTLLVLGLRAGTPYTLTPVADEDGATTAGPALPFTSGALPADAPAVHVEVPLPALVQPGITIFGVAPETQMGQAPTSPPLYVGVDSDGAIVWYYRDETAQAPRDYDAKLQDDDTLLLTLGQEFRVITLGGETVASIRGGTDVPLHHDALILPGGNALVLSNETRSLDVPSLGGTVRVKGDRIVELDKSGQAVWEWSAFDELDTGRFPGPLSQTPNQRTGEYDWTHANALVYLPADDSLLLSARHQSWLVKISHKAGKVLWKLGSDGDFRMQDGAWFYSQHAPEPHPDGTFLVYDNGNERPEVGVPYSRAVAYQLDEAQKTVRQTWEYRTETYTSFLGDANRLANGNVLVCAGGDRDGGTGAGIPIARLTEVTFEKAAQKVWELETEGYVYRATRIPEFGQDAP